MVTALRHENLGAVFISRERVTVSSDSGIKAFIHCCNRHWIVYSKTGRKEEAYRIFEGMLFADYQRIQMALNDLRMLYMEDEDHAMVHRLVNTSSKMASAFDMGRYNEVSMGLDVAAWEKDTERTAQIMRELLESVETVGAFADSDLYRHMVFKKSDPEFYRKIRDNLIQSMNDDSFRYMKGNDFWENLLKNKNSFSCTTEETLEN